MGSCALPMHQSWPEKVHLTLHFTFDFPLPLIDFELMHREDSSFLILQILSSISFVYVVYVHVCVVCACATADVYQSVCVCQVSV